jgi:hypothetical protein
MPAIPCMSSIPSTPDMSMPGMSCMVGGAAGDAEGSETEEGECSCCAQAGARARSMRASVIRVRLPKRCIGHSLCADREGARAPFQCGGSSPQTRPARAGKLVRRFKRRSAGARRRIRWRSGQRDVVDRGAEERRGALRRLHRRLGHAAEGRQRSRQPQDGSRVADPAADRTVALYGVAATALLRGGGYVPPCHPRHGCQVAG